MIEQPYPNLEKLLEMVGDAGLRMSQIDACEGAAGNISVCLRWEVEVQALFPRVEKIELPQPAPGLVGALIIVSGSGCRLREIGDRPVANLACLVVDEGGLTASQYTAPDSLLRKVTSEFNSHLAVHNDRIISTGTNFHAVIHAQPPYLTYLSHIPRYQDTLYLNQHILRWQPEMIVQLPEGIGIVPFTIPGSDELAALNSGLFRTHRLIIWAKHGVMACSDISVKHASDRIEYAEASARYEFMNLAAGEIGDGLTPQEIRSICIAFNVRQNYF